MLRDFATIHVGQTRMTARHFTIGKLTVQWALPCFLRLWWAE